MPGPKHRPDNQAEKRPSKGALGGSRNEGGAEFRSGLVTYLAAHALAGEPLTQLPGQPVPTSIVLEADTPVDDIVCHCENAKTLYIQAKRSVGRSTFLSVLEAQFVPLVESGTDLSESFMLVCADIDNVELRVIRDALERNRQTIETSYTAEEWSLVQTIAKRSAHLSSAQRDVLLEHSYVAVLDAESPTGQAMREAKLLLERSVVEPGFGQAAIAALRSEAHQKASKRLGATVQDWVDALSDLGIPLSPQSSSPSGRALMVAASVRSYLAQYSAKRNRISFSLLGSFLSDLRVSSLLQAYEVIEEKYWQGAARNSSERLNQEKLSILARRWGRATILGLPGSGKSTALEQLAADWSLDGWAPTPILVRLSDVARRCGELGRALSQPELLELALAGLPQSYKPFMQEFLEEAASAGTAGFLFDALDECGAATGYVASTIERVLTEAHSDCMVIVTAREALHRTTERFNLPKAFLLPPYNLKAVLREIVNQASASIAPPALQAEWIERRWNWVSAHMEQDKELWDVPLLSTLMTLLACKTSRLDDLPATRADLIARVIDSSIEDWEAVRSRQPDMFSNSRHLTVDQLLDAFASLGHLLAGGTTSKTEVISKLGSDLSAALSVSVQTGRRVASEVVRYWDEGVGVFVEDGTSGHLRPRSKLFAEIADARWAVEQSNETKSAWHAERADDVAQQESLVLACLLDPYIGDLQFGLLATDDTEPAQLVLSACLRIVRESSAAPASYRSELAHHLHDLLLAHSHDDEELWPLWLEYAQLALKEDESQSRLANFGPFEGERRTILLALSARAQIEARGGEPPSDAEAIALREVLSLALPPEMSSEERYEYDERGRRRKVFHVLGGGSQTAGRSQAILAAVSILQLSEQEASKACALAARTGVRDNIAIASVLRDKGHPEAMEDYVRHLALPAGFLSPAIQEVKDKREDHQSILASHSPTTVPWLESARDWMLRDYADLTAVIDMGSLAFRTISNSDMTTFTYFRLARLYALCADIDFDRVCFQAARALENSGGEPDPFYFFLVASPSPKLEPSLRNHRLDDEALSLLIELIVSSDELETRLAQRLAGAMKSTQIYERLMEVGPPQAAIPRFNWAMTILKSSQGPEESWSAWLYDEDPALRLAAAIFVANSPNPNIRDRSRFYKLLMNHPDDSVRARIENEVPAHWKPSDYIQQDASYWLCIGCRSKNEVGNNVCPSCGRNV